MKRVKKLRAPNIRLFLILEIYLFLFGIVSNNNPITSEVIE